jgi:hypothetical protein
MDCFQRSEPNVQVMSIAQSSKMPDRVMAADARKHFGIFVCPFYALDYLLMTFSTSLLGDFAVVRLDSERVGITARRKSERVPEPV